MSEERARVLLSPDQTKVWIQNRNLLRAAADNNRCRCGERMSLRGIKRGGLLKRVDQYCVHRKWSNFWKHSPPKTVLEY